MSSTTLVCPKTGSTSPSLTSIFAYTLHCSGKSGMRPYPASEHRLRLRGERLLYRVEQHRTHPGRSRSPSGPSPPPTGAPRPPSPARCALLESLVARLRRAFRVREVALRFLVRLAIRPLVRRTALRVPILPAAADRARRPSTEPPLPDAPSLPGSPPDALLADATPPADHRPEPPRPSARPRPRQPHRLTQQRLDLAFQALFLFLHPVVAVALRLLAFARTFVPSIDSFPKRARPNSCARRTTSIGNPPGADAETRTASGVAESCPPPAPGNQRPLPASERPYATRTPPSRRHRAAPSPSSEARTARCDGLVQSVERRSRPSTRSLTWCAKWPSGSHSRTPATAALVRHIGAECGRHRVLPSSARLQLSHRCVF